MRLMLNLALTPYIVAIGIVLIFGSPEEQMKLVGSMLLGFLLIATAISIGGLAIVNWIEMWFLGRLRIEFGIDV